MTQMSKIYLSIVIKGQVEVRLVYPINVCNFEILLLGNNDVYIDNGMK